MSELSDIRPSQQQRVIDLVRAAGVDVSGWGNYKGGKAKAAANPKYCYAEKVTDLFSVTKLAQQFARSLQF